MPLEGLHTDRTRASGFGDVALAYDAYRSGYPDALIQDLLTADVASVLDIGCGTGKVAAAILARGRRVLGVEPDARMAVLARGAGVEVDESPLEAWVPAGRRFDLVTAGHSWHWVDPALGPQKVLEALRPGALFARFWNLHAVDPSVLADLEAAYAEHAPELYVVGSPPDPSPLQDPLTGVAGFEALEPRTYTWTRVMTVHEWVGMLGTFSDHVALGAPRFAALTTAIKGAVAQHGDALVVHGSTLCMLARSSCA